METEQQQQQHSGSSRGVFIVAKRRRCEIEDPSEIEQIQGIKVSASASASGGENSPATVEDEEAELPPEQQEQQQQQQQHSPGHGEAKNPLDLELGYMCMDGQVPGLPSSPSAAPGPAGGSTSTTSTSTPNHLSNNNSTSGSSSSSQKTSTPLATSIKTESGLVPPLVVDQQQHTGPVPVLIPSNPSFSSAMSPPSSIMIQTSQPNNNSNNVQNVATGAISGSTSTSGLGTASGAYAQLLGLGQVKRKRGRPRKYVETGTAGATPVFLPGTGTVPVVTGYSALQSSPPPVISSPVTPGSGGMALALAPLAASASHGQLPFALAASPSTGGGQPERKRGRPPGTGKKQQLAALGAFLAQAGTTGQGFTGQGFTPHVITIAAGEDVATRIITFAQIGTRTTCVLSANGVISNVTLRQPATSGGTVTYEGRFEILSLTGSFLLTDSGNTRSRSGGLSVSLAGPDGRVIGGGVAGLLIAATPVQVVVGSFVTESRKPAVHLPVRPHSGSSNDMMLGVTSPMSITRPAVMNESNNTSSQMTWSRSQEEHQQSSQQQQQQQQHQQQQSHSQQQEQEQEQQSQGQENEGHGTDINILPTSC